MPQEGGRMQMEADAVELQTNVDDEAGVGFNMHVGAEGWSSDCSVQRQGMIASPQMGGKVKESRHPSGNRPEHRKFWKPNLPSW